MIKEKEFHKPPIFVVSGGKGLAGHTVVQSILIQYPNNKLPVFVVPDVLSAEKADEVTDQVVKKDGIIVHTMVSPYMRKILTEKCEEKGIIHFDLVKDLSAHLNQVLQIEPINRPGLYRLRNIEYYQRIKAIEFTLQHDDGQDVERILKADIVLTGVSRSGKTPLSVYMAMFGWKVANVPLVTDIPPPEALFKVNPQRVFGLTISLGHLIAQRSNRVSSLNMPPDSDYITPRMVRKELDYAMRIFKRGGFTVWNNTNKPVETSANEILNMVTSRFGRDQWKIDDAALR